MGSQPIRIQLGENLVGNSCGKILQQIIERKFLWEIIEGNSCGKILQENLVGNGGGEKVNLRKAVICGNLAFGIGWWGANRSGFSSGKSCRKSCRKILWENLVGNSCGKILREILVGKSCEKILWEMEEGEKVNLRKAATGGNLAFGIGWWGANQSGSSSGKSCGKFFRENLAGNFYGKILWEILVGKSCRKLLRENLEGNSCGKWRRGKSQFKKGSDWWKFSIWNRVMGSQLIRIQLRKILQEIVAGKPCGKFLWENLAANHWKKILWEIIAGNSCRKILQENLVGKSWGNHYGTILQEKEEGKKPI